MDIHPPHSPIRSLRDFAIQLITITAGVLIALSLEGLRETYREHVLVSEAHEMLAREIADNRKDVENVLGSLSDQRQNLVVALRFADDLLARKRTDVRELSLKLDFAELSNASWTGAERTGALALEEDFGKHLSETYRAALEK
jgi:hypothetical protein